MKKAFFFDVDGTIVDFLRGLNDPSKKTAHAFRELNKEYITIITSGRTYDMIPDSIRNMEPGGYLLCNGAYCKIKDEELFSCSLDEDVVRDTISFSEDCDAVYYIETDRGIYTNGLGHPLHEWAMTVFKDETPYSDISFRDDRPVNMISMLFHNDEDLKRYVKQFEDRMDIRLQFDGMTYLDCNIPGINKGTGIKQCLQQLGIDQENAYAFGDSYNDVEMMEAVGNPIAMGNAVDEIKNIASKVIGDVIDDGIYEYLLEEGLIGPCEEDL